MQERIRIPVSVLSLASVPPDGSISGAFENVVTLAQTADRLGLERFWIAEHHNLPSVTSAATSVLIGHVAGKTSRIRVGSGGIMLPNHAPLVIAENFGTLATLYPNRIELGLGRAPGTDPYTSRALRRELMSTGNDFPALVEELQALFAPAVEGQRIRAVPGAGIPVPIWILGSSLWSADFAARMGLPYAFAAHFAPTDLMEALEIYRRRFVPSDVLLNPHTMACIPVVAAATDREAAILATTPQQRILGILRGKRPSVSPAPVETMEGIWTPAEAAGVDNFLREAIIGSPATVRMKLHAFLERTRVDELMVHTELHRVEDSVRSLEITAEVAGRKSGNSPEHLAPSLSRASYTRTIN